MTDNVKVAFNAEHLERAAALAFGDEKTLTGRLRVACDVQEIACWVRDNARWPIFSLGGDATENRAALKLHKLVVRLARHDGYGAPANPLDAAAAAQAERRRMRAKKPAELDFWDLSQDEMEGTA